MLYNFFKNINRNATHFVACNINKLDDLKIILILFKKFVEKYGVLDIL